MYPSLKRVLAAVVLGVAATGVMSQAARAQSTDDTIPEAFDEILFNDSRPFYESGSYWQQFRFMFGPGFFGRAGFPELTATRDAEALNRAWTEAMHLQNETDPVLRVPDLRNPYNTSVQLMPSSQPGAQVTGSELFFERLPMP